MQYFEAHHRSSRFTWTAEELSYRSFDTSRVVVPRLVPMQQPCMEICLAVACDLNPTFRNGVRNMNMVHRVTFG